MYTTITFPFKECFVFIFFWLQNGNKGHCYCKLLHFGSVEKLHFETSFWNFHYQKKKNRDFKKYCCFRKQRVNLYCCEHVLLQFGKGEIHESFYCYIIILWVCNFPNIGNKVYHIKESFITNNLPRNYLHKKHIVMPSKLVFIFISFLYYIFIFLWRHLKKGFSKIFKFHMTNSVSVVSFSILCQKW